MDPVAEASVEEVKADDPVPAENPRADAPAEEVKAEDLSEDMIQSFVA